MGKVGLGAPWYQTGWAAETQKAIVVDAECQETVCGPLEGE